MPLSRLCNERQPKPPPAATEQAEVRLLARIAGGDRQAFEALYRAYYPRLARFLDHLTRPSTLVDEVLNGPPYPVQPAARLWQLSALHEQATGRNVSVVVIDIDADHPVLAGQLAHRENSVDDRPDIAEQRGTARRHHRSGDR